VVLEARASGKASEVLSSIMDAVDRFAGEANKQTICRGRGHEGCGSALWH